VSDFLHVLVPAYGRSPYLADALRSVLAADEAGVRLTVVDDGTPSSVVADICREAGVEYQRLPENLGVAGAFQACATRSTGEYTMIMGSDDLMGRGCPAALRCLAESYGRPELVTTRVMVLDGSGREVRPLPDRVKSLLGPSSARGPRLLSGDRLVASLLTGNWLYFPAVAWRTDVLRRHAFRADMETALDLALELAVLFEGGSLAWSPVREFGYRRHAESVSSQSAVQGRRFEEERAVFAWAGQRAAALNWRRSSVSARLQVTSRLHRGLAWVVRLLGRTSVIR
jgi:glycosyltransferase involved in cell wall biosynthesis